MALVFQPLTKDKGIFTADFGNASLQNKDKRVERKGMFCESIDWSNCNHQEGMILQFNANFLAKEKATAFF